MIIKLMFSTFFLLFSASVFASVVYTQAPATTPSFATSAYINFANDQGFNGNSDADSQIWATFKTASNISFNRITWYGSASDGNFAIDFHTTTQVCPSCGLSWVNSSGSYAATSSNTEVLPTSGPYTNAQVHETLVSGSLYSYYIDLPTKVALDSTKLNVISFVNNYSSLPFGWASSSTGNSTSMDWVVGRAILLNRPGYFAFTLSDTTVSAVPVPSAVWLFGSVLAGLGIIGKRRIA